MSRDVDGQKQGQRASRSNGRGGISYQSSDQVQESAQALVQLAQSGLGQVATTGEDDLAVRRPPSHPRSQLTSNQIIQQAAAARFGARRAKAERRKQAQTEGRAAAAQAVASLGLNEPQSSFELHDEMNGEETATAYPLEDCFTAPVSSHPLDEVSTDDEYTETPNFSPDVTSISGLPTYSISQREKARAEASSDLTQHNAKRKKLSARHQAVTRLRVDIDESPQSTESDQMIQREDHSTWQSKDSASVAEYNQSPIPGIADIAIDPALEQRSISARDQWSAPSRNDGKAMRASKASSANPPKTKRVRKRNQKDRYAGSVVPEGAYVSPYTGDVQLDQSEVAPNEQGVTEDGLIEDVRADDADEHPRTGQNCFGSKEIGIIERFRQSWCTENARQPREFNELVQSNLRANHDAVELFQKIQELFPHHQAVYIQRFCRRKFHNFAARGTWTAEEDEKLRLAVADKGTSWKRVGHMINRFPEDCRDRWRNYLSVPERVNKDSWTDAEIRGLARCIFDCFYDKILDHWQRVTDTSGYFPPAGPEVDLNDVDVKIINWQTVSDRMLELGLRRTRLQCSYKWSTIREIEQHGLLQHAQEGRINNSDTLMANEENRTKQGDGWRSRNAQRDAQRMLSGDKMDLLDAILSCGARSEEAIVWKTLGPSWFQQRWSTGERKAGWLALKASLESSHFDDYRYVAQRLLEQFSGAEKDDRYDFRSAPQKRTYKKRASRGDTGAELSTPGRQATAGGVSGTQQVSREVIEINSDDGDGDFQPLNHLASSSDMMDHDGLNNRPVTRGQTTSGNGAMSGLDVDAENDRIDPIFELTGALDVLGPGAELSPSLTRRVLGLQHA